MKLTLFFFLIVFASCNKVEYKGETVHNVVGKIYYAGQIAADGCEWIVEIESARYHPEDLSEEFLENDLDVVLSYREITSK
ncbi:MAG: hypothetical protein H7Y31_15340, partial [Chitinophagaceae bacterium]|nr:hypothetical protein [Chitinophagaceae bacterium]